MYSKIINYRCYITHVIIQFCVIVLLRWAMGLANWLVTGDLLPPNNPNEIIHLLSS
jgi:hypothetical protein